MGRKAAQLCLACGLLLTWLGGSQAVCAQQISGVTLGADEQIFCVLAALNAGGYDTGIGVNTGDNARGEVRSLLAKKNVTAVSDIEKFYFKHHIAGNPGADLGQYISLALRLGPPPDFHFTVARADLPPDAEAVAGFVPLLKRFYKEADLAGMWRSLRPRYQATIDRYSPPVRRAITLSDAYLRFPSGTYLGRTYNVYFALLGAPDDVQARIYGLHYYVVVTPSKSLKVDQIRHQYLHFLLDPLAAKYAADIKQKAELKIVAAKAPMLRADFKADFYLFTTECLIRAVELRMDKVTPTEAKKKINALTASGLILTPYFYSALGAYEQQASSMSVYYKKMIDGIDTRSVMSRLAKVKFTSAPPVTPPVHVVRSEEERLLDEGDNLIYRGQYNQALNTFETVLKKYNPNNERALYGLGVVASNMRKPDLAEQYFQKALQSGHDVRIATWSHIYLGRLYDLTGKRSEALEQYRAASRTAGPYPEAMRAAKSGLDHPFGSNDSKK